MSTPYLTEEEMERSYVHLASHDGESVLQHARKNLQCAIQRRLFEVTERVRIHEIELVEGSKTGAISMEFYGRTPLEELYQLIFPRRLQMGFVRVGFTPAQTPSELQESWAGYFQPGTVARIVNPHVAYSLDTLGDNPKMTLTGAHLVVAPEQLSRIAACARAQSIRDFLD